MVKQTDPVSVYRENMVKQQLRTNTIQNPRVLSLFETVPRHEFVPKAMREFAYSDLRIPLANNQQMMTPEEEARLLQALNLQGYETILEVGTGSGYLTALLSRLGKKVISVDCFENFTQDAARKTQDHGYTNIEFITADASQGYLPQAPYDVIVMTGAIPSITKTLALQRIPGGKLFAIVGNAPIMCGNLYSQQLGFRQGARERVKGVYTQYITDDERSCNTAENTSAKSIYTLDHQEQWQISLVFETDTPPLIDKLKPQQFKF